VRQLLIFLIVAVALQFVLAWALAHYRLVVLGGCSWWVWSLWQGPRRA